MQLYIVLMSWGLIEYLLQGAEISIHSRLRARLGSLPGFLAPEWLEGWFSLQALQLLRHHLAAELRDLPAYQLPFPVGELGGDGLVLALAGIALGFDEIARHHAGAGAPQAGHAVGVTCGVPRPVVGRLAGGEIAGDGFEALATDHHLYR